MGNDGGSFTHRTEVVKMKKKAKKIEKNEEANIKKQMLCAYTKEKLKRSQMISACKCGNLFSKEAIVRCLLERNKMPKGLEHIKKLKDIRDVQFNDNQEMKNGSSELDNKPEDKNSATVKLICPLTQIEYTGFNTFYVSWSCGCIISENALRELKGNNTELKECLVCSQPIAEQNPADAALMKHGHLVQINMPDDKKVEIQTKLLQQIKDKKKNKDKGDGGASLLKKRDGKNLLKNIEKLSNHSAEKDDANYKKRKLETDEAKNAENKNDIMPGKSMIYKSLFHKNEGKQEVTLVQNANASDFVNRGQKLGLR